MLADIAGIGHAVERADELVARCRERAVRAGVDGRDADGLHEWALARMDVRDPIVERAFNALFRRDAAWGAADYEHDPFDRYTWELAAEMADEPRELRDLWTFSLGSFESCGEPYEVLLHRPSERCPGVPHLHVRRERRPRVPDVCVGLYEAVYVPFGHRHWELDHRHREDLADFLEALLFPGEGWPRWYRAEHCWDDACGEDGVPEAVWTDFERMPDYRALRWPDREGTSS